jgi:nucleotide-binding universal stress UspA family protein
MPIVVGHSTSAQGQAALERAIAEARMRSTSLHVVRVVEARSSEDPHELDEFRASLASAEEDGRALEARLAAEGLEASVLVEVASAKDPAEVLLDVVERVDADLLVIGMRSRSRVGKLVLGSVSQDVLLAASCPVLTVKAEEG